MKTQQYNYLIVKVCGYHDFTDISWTEPLCVCLTLISANRMLSTVKRISKLWNKKLQAFEKLFNTEHPNPGWASDKYSEWVKLHKSRRSNLVQSFDATLYNNDVKLFRRIDKGSDAEEFVIEKIEVR